MVIALVLLLVLTLMAITGMQISSMQERMAGNMRDASLAFQSAEAALRDAEVYIRENRVNDNSTIQFELKFENEENGHYQPDTTLWVDQNTWSNNASSIQIGYDIVHVSSQARYIIEEIEYAWDGDSVDFGPIPDIYFYRITSMAVGGNENTEVLLQSVYIR